MFLRRRSRTHEEDHKLLLNSIFIEDGNRPLMSATNTDNHPFLLLKCNAGASTAIITNSSTNNLDSHISNTTIAEHNTSNFENSVCSIFDQEIEGYYSVADDVELSSNFDSEFSSLWEGLDQMEVVQVDGGVDVNSNITEPVRLGNHSSDSTVDLIQEKGDALFLPTLSFSICSNDPKDEEEEVTNLKPIPNFIPKSPYESYNGGYSIPYLNQQENIHANSSSYMFSSTPPFIPTIPNPPPHSTDQLIISMNLSIKTQDLIRKSRKSMKQMEFMDKDILQELMYCMQDTRKSRERLQKMLSQSS